MKSQTLKFLAFFTLLPIGNAFSAPVFFDNFDSYTVGVAADDATYATRYSNTATNITITADTGLSASQAWNIGGDNTIVRKDIGIDFVNGGPQLISSIFFQYPGTGGLAGPQIGFTLIPTGNVTGIGDLTGRLNNNALQLRKNNATVSTGSTLTLTSSNWYQLVYTLERTATADTFALRLELFNASSGGVVGSSVGSHSDTTTDAAFYADSDIYFVMRENTAISAMDNLQVSQVPEPGAIGLMTIAAIGFLGRRKISR